MLNKETHWNPIRSSPGRRVVAAESHWNLPAKWNAAAEREGVRRRVFCGAMADVFEDWRNLVRDTNGRPLHHAQAWGHAGHWAGIDGVFIGQSIVTLDDVRRRVFETFDATPWLDWIVPTKWPQNVRRMWPTLMNSPCRDGEGNVSHDFIGDRCIRCGGSYRSNVWLLANVSDQHTIDAIVPALLECRDLVPVLGLSCELVGPLNLTKYVGGRLYRCKCGYHSTEVELSFSGGNRHSCVECGMRCEIEQSLDWVIVGGESGPNARPCRVEWIDSIVNQCLLAGVPCFVKQLGAKAIVQDEETNSMPVVLDLRDKKGGDWSEWSEDLRVREFPEVRP